MHKAPYLPLRVFDVRIIIAEEAGVTDLRMVSPPLCAPSGPSETAAPERSKRNNLSPLHAGGFSGSEAEGQLESEDTVEQDVVLEEEASPAAQGQLIDYPSQDPLQFLDKLELVEEAEHQARGDSPPPGPVDYDLDENEPHETVTEVKL